MKAPKVIDWTDFAESAGIPRDEAGTELRDMIAKGWFRIDAYGNVKLTDEGRRLALSRTRGDA